MNKEYGMAFCGNTIPRVIDGSKTQTRRKPNNANCILIDMEGGKLSRSGWKDILWDNPQMNISDDGLMLYAYLSQTRAIKITHKISAGDIIWMKEAYCFPCRDYRGDDSYYKKQPILYRVDAEKLIDGHIFGEKECRWISSRYLPKRFYRQALIVKNVKFQWLQSISEDDSVAEGVEAIDRDFDGNIYYKDYKRYKASELRTRQTYCSARESFSSLWDSINSKIGWGWDLNRPVLVCEFERKKN